jgi:hypothetical protein
VKEPKPLRARKRMKRKTPMKAKPPRRLKTVQSDPDYLAWVRTLSCVLACVAECLCNGPVEAHHAGRRPGTGIKADDRTAIPLCTKHHRCWHDMTGPFALHDKAARRDWADRRIAETQARYIEEQSEAA